MYTISIRIPYSIMNTRQYVNAAVISAYPVVKGELVWVVQKIAPSIPLQAEVIESIWTNREDSSYDWKLLSS